MPPRHRRTGGLLLAALLGLVQPAWAQQGVLSGRVTDLETGLPVDGAQIQVLGLSQPTGRLSDASGRYEIPLPAGEYSLVTVRVGFREERFDGVRVEAGVASTFDIRLRSVALALNEIIISASRGAPEKQVDAPAATHLVSATEIEERPVLTLTDHLRAAPATDVMTQGLLSTNIVIRGFNNVFSGALHVLTDHRLAGLPSLRVNNLHYLPTTNLDVERMEVVLGPGSALYGPNTADGVLHILTKSPLDEQATTVTVGAGERSVLQGEFRSSFLLNETLGVKVSGQYMQGQEWPYSDATEDSARARADVDPQACLTDKLIRGYSAADGQLFCDRLGLRNPDLERYSVEARVDWRHSEDGTLVVTYGRNAATGLELTGLGAGQGISWIYQYYQARVTKGKLFAQAYYNGQDGGGSYLLRDGVSLIDKSAMWVGQVQHGLSLADDRQDFTYGVDYFATRPRTGGSINGTYEDDDDIDEWGAYLQSKTRVSDRLDLVLAGRIDGHSGISDNAFSPRAALVFNTGDDQSLRITYNRAFSTPTPLNFFLDLSGGASPGALGSLGYTIRAYGTGRNGFGLQNPDGSLRGFRSPFNPGGAGQLLDADVGTLWGLALGVLQAQGAVDASTAALLAGLDPTANDIGILLLDGNTSQVTALPQTRLDDIPGLRESITETLELGWQGVIDNRLRVSADVYWMRKKDLIGPLRLVTPLLLLNGADIPGFINGPIVEALTQQFLSQGLDEATAAAQAQAQAAALVPAIAAGIGQLPLGVASSQDIAAQGADLIVTYTNLGDIDLWGADVSFSWFMDDHWTMSGTYSHMSDDYFPIEGSSPLPLNAPKDKGSLGLAYRNPRKGLNAEGRVRYTSRFPAESAGLAGTRCIRDVGEPVGIFEEDCVAASALVDVNFGYRVPGTQATLQLAVSNLFNRAYRSFVGVPSIGRMAMLRVKYDLF